MYYRPLFFFSQFSFPGYNLNLTDLLYKLTILLWLRYVHLYVLKVLNSLPNVKILDMTKLQIIADNKFNVTKMTISLYDRVENTVGKGENAGYHHFLVFPQCFPKPFSLGGVPRGSMVKCLTRNPGILGSSRTRSSGFFHGSVLGPNTSEPQPRTDDTQERHE